MATRSEAMRGNKNAAKNKPTEADYAAQDLRIAKYDKKSFLGKMTTMPWNNPFLTNTLPQRPLVPTAKEIEMAKVENNGVDPKYIRRGPTLIKNPNYKGK